MCRQLLHCFLVCLFSWLAVSALAQAQSGQAQSGPPVFAPDDKEGLKLTRNPSVRYAFKRKVFWKQSVGGNMGFYGKSPQPTPAERAAMTGTLNAMAALFQATLRGREGEGFWVNDSRTLGGVDVLDMPESFPVARVPHQFASGYFPFYHEDYLNAGTWQLSRKGETESAYFYFNRLPREIGQQVLAKEEQGGGRNPIEFYLRPRVSGRWQGLPVYEEKVLVVARAGRDPWVGVPVPRVLRAAMPLYEQDRKTAEERLAGLKKTNEELQSPAYEQRMWEQFEKNNGALKTTRPSNYEARKSSTTREIAYNRKTAAEKANPQRDANGSWYWNPVEAHEAAQRLLASLAGAGAGKTACYVEATGLKKEGRYQMRGDLVPLGSQMDCREVVTTNWDYFDPKLARTAAQILTAVDFGRCAKLEGERLVSIPVRSWDFPPQGCVQHAQMWRELDWAKLAALVVP
jgi:hypothetical protein